MNSAEIERIVDIIACDEIETQEFLPNDNPVQLILRTPNLKEKARAARIYAQEFSKARFTGMPDEKEAINDYMAIGQWSQVDEDKISGLREDIHKVKRGLLDLLFRPEHLEKARSLLRRAEFALVEKISERQSLLRSTAEAHALLAQQRYIIGQITFIDNGDKFWPTREIFDASSDLKLIDHLCTLFFRTSRIGIGKMRLIARSNIWRAIWSCSRKTGDLFSKPIIELSANQQELIHWSCIYDNVYEAVERPSEDIIDDDDLLDSWFIRQGEKIEDRAKKESGEKIASNKGRKGGRNEQFIFSDEKGAKRVYDLNDQQTRRTIQVKQALVHKEGSVKEKNMPDSQNEIRKIAMDQRRRSIMNKK